MDRTPVRYTSPVVVYEAVLGAARALNVPIPAALASVDQFIKETATRLMPICEEIGRAAWLHLTAMGGAGIRLP